MKNSAGKKVSRSVGQTSLRQNNPVISILGGLPSFLPERIANNVGRPPENLIRSWRDRVILIAAEFRARVSIVLQREKDWKWEERSKWSKRENRWRDSEVREQKPSNLTKTRSSVRGTWCEISRLSLQDRFLSWFLTPESGEGWVTRFLVCFFFSRLSLSFLRRTASGWASSFHHCQRVVPLGNGNFVGILWISSGK